MCRKCSYARWFLRRDDLSLCVNNVVRGAWGAALLNLELYDLHVRPLIARARPR